MAEALSHNLKLIGRYSILRELRRDRYTVAYLAFDPVLNRAATCVLTNDVASY